MAQTNKDLIVMLEELFKKAPALPLSAKDVLVKITPWIALVFGILGILVGIGAAGVSPIALFGGIKVSVTVLISGILLLISSVLMLIAFPKLKAMKFEGWRLIFWADAISIVSAIVTFDLVSAVISFLIGFYILFQIKSYYK